MRIYRLDSYPSLNPDEAALGYNAYSLLQTGRDEHGIPWPIHFKSFGDYKPGGYVYLLLPFIKILGLNTFTVRVPNLIASLFILLFAYKIILLLSKNKNLSLLTTLLMSISPWAIHFSRGAWESNLAFCFILAAAYYFLANQHTKSAFFFASSLYTYHSARLFSPLLILFLVFFVKKYYTFSKKTLIVFLLILGMLSIPVFISFTFSGGTTRFSGVGLGADQGPIWRANELINHHQSTNLEIRILHNKRILYLLSWAEKYTSHFSLNYLFSTGDQVPRSKVPNMGQTYLFFLPFFFVGLFTLFKKETPQEFKYFILFWLLVSPLASSLTYQAPSSLRSLPEVFALESINALGVYHVFLFIKQRTKFFIPLTILFTTISLYSLFFYLINYYLLYPKVYPLSWPWQAKEAIFSHHYGQINADQPYIMYLFYTAYDPTKLQKQIHLTPPDKYGFSTVEKIDNITFTSQK